MSGIRVPNCSKSTINWKNDDSVIICRHDVIFRLFWHCHISSLITDPSFLSISLIVLDLWQFLFISDLTRNLKIGNTSTWVLSNIWRLWELGIPIGKLDIALLKKYGVESIIDGADQMVLHRNEVHGKKKLNFQGWNQTTYVKENYMLSRERATEYLYKRKGLRVKLILAAVSSLQ